MLSSSRRFLAIALSVLLQASSNSNITAAFDYHKGLYLIGQYQYIGDLPAEFKEFSSIDIYSVSSKSDRVTGKVKLNSGSRDPKFISAQLANDRFSFTTESIAGLSYKFEGRILRIRVPKEEGSHEIPQLDGSLIKIQSRQKVAEVSGRFRYEEFGD